MRKRRPETTNDVAFVDFDDRRPPHPLRTGRIANIPEKGSHWLDPEDLVQLVRLGPLVSIDLIVQDPAGRMLVGLRNNEPAKDSWFVPGGRVGKGESLDDAFRRIIRDELGLSRARESAELLGVFEHFYSTNFAETPGLGTHYIVLAHRIPVESRDEVVPDNQHRQLRWDFPRELAGDPAVHRNTRVYAELPQVAGQGR